MRRGFSTRRSLGVLGLALTLCLSCGDDPAGPANPELESASRSTGNPVRGPEILGVRLGMSVVEAEGPLAERFGTPLQRGSAGDGFGEFAVPDAALRAHPAQLLELGVRRFALVVDEELRVRKLYVLLAGSGEGAPACDAASVSKLAAFAREATGDAQPETADARFGSVREDYARFRAETFQLDTLVTRSDEGCHGVAFELATVGLPGLLDHHRNLERMIAAARESRGFLSRDHGTYVPSCGGSRIDDTENRKREFTIWSEGEVAYLNAGRRVDPSAARRIASLGARSVEVNGGERTLQAFRLRDDGGAELEIAIGDGFFAFVEPDGSTTEALTRCEGWAW